MKRVSTRKWAQGCYYDPEKIFTKLFQDDINYLLKMENLWKERTPPVPLKLKSLTSMSCIILLCENQFSFIVLSRKSSLLPESIASLLFIATDGSFGSWSFQLHFKTKFSILFNLLTLFTPDRCSTYLKCRPQSDNGVEWVNNMTNG